MTSALSAAWAAAELDALSAAGRLRRRPIIEGGNDRRIILAEDGRRRSLINWASNDYLGNAQALTVRNAAAKAVRAIGAGAGSARLLAGGLRIHRRLEQRLAHWLDSDEVLITTSGFQGNLAVLATLASSRDDVIILDRLAHASLYDGARLSGAACQRFAHNDCAALQRRLASAAAARRRVVVVESVYSMDGDEAPLADIAALCRSHDALLVVDEAHALGVYGPGGRGVCAAVGVCPDVLTATCSKALGSQGGVIAAAAPVVELIVNRGRSFIFSTAAVPAAPAAAIASLDRLRRDPSMGERLLAAAAALRAALTAQGWSVMAGGGPIIPLLIGDEQHTVALAAALRERGHYAPAIRPPTVPPGSCRLRLTLTLAHTAADQGRLLRELEAVRSVVA